MKERNCCNKSEIFSNKLVQISNADVRYGIIIHSNDNGNIIRDTNGTKNRL